MKASQDRRPQTENRTQEYANIKQFERTTAIFGGCVKWLEDGYFWSPYYIIKKYGAECFGLVLVLGPGLWISASSAARLSQTEILFFLQVNRPLSMKKEGIQTRKRKPKNPGQGNQGSPAGPMSSVIKTDIKAGIQHGKLNSYRFICGLQIKT